jgi:hypothetical protein
VSCVSIYSIVFLRFKSRTPDEQDSKGMQEQRWADLSHVAIATAATLIFACSLIIVSLACSLFGTQVTPPAPILKALPKIFGHSDKAVRSEGTNLAHALYQYLGTGIEPWITDLKPVQVKELKEAWESMEKEGRGKGSLKPERMTRQQARDAEQNADSGEGDAGDDSAVVEGASTISIVCLRVRMMRNRSCTSGSSTICRTSRYHTETSCKSPC